MHAWHEFAVTHIRLGTADLHNNLHWAGRVKFVTVGLKDQDLQVVLWPGTPGKADPTAGPIPGTCIIDTSDLQGDFERLKSLGIEFVEKNPIVYPNGGGYANFTDPDGNRLSLRGS